MKVLKMALVLVLSGMASQSFAGTFVGGGLSVGQMRPTSGDPGLAFGVLGELGTNISISPFRHIMVGGELLKGVSAYRDKDNLSSKIESSILLFKAGYGYAPSELVNITWEAAVGPSVLTFSASSDDIEVKSDDRSYGLNVRAGVSAQVTLNDYLSGVAGINWQYSSVDISSVKVNGSTVGSGHFEGSKSFQTPAAYVGVRAQLK